MKAPFAPTTYVVRVYRRGTGPALAGTVETVRDGDRRAFDSLEGLGAILALPAPRKPRRGRKSAEPESA